MNRIVRFVAGHRLALAASALALVVVTSGAAVGGIASAQTPTQTPTTPTAPTAPPGSDLDKSFWAALAARLGVTSDRLNQAVKDAAKDTIANALSNNSITQAQADQLNQRADQWQPGQGLPFGGPHGGGPGHGGGLFHSPAVLDAAAKALGMTTADLQTALQGGKTLADVAKEKNVDTATLKQAMVDAAKAQVDADLAAGRLTQDQATQMKTRIDQEAANLDLSQPFFGRGGFPGGGHGPGDWGAPPGGQNGAPAPQGTATPSGTGA